MNDEARELEKAWNGLTEYYPISAREYFYILRLALYHVDGVKTDNSFEVAQATKSPEVYKCAIKILKVMYEE